MASTGEWPADMLLREVAAAIDLCRTANSEISVGKGGAVRSGRKRGVVRPGYSAAGNAGHPHWQSPHEMRELREVVNGWRDQERGRRDGRDREMAGSVGLLRDERSGEMRSCTRHSHCVFPAHCRTGNLDVVPAADTDTGSTAQSSVPGQSSVNNQSRDLRVRRMGTQFLHLLRSITLLPESRDARRSQKPPLPRRRR